MNNLTFPFYYANIIIGEYHAVLFIIPRRVAASDRSPGAVGVPPDKTKSVCLITTNHPVVSRTYLGGITVSASPTSFSTLLRLSRVSCRVNSVKTRGAPDWSTRLGMQGSQLG